MPLFAMLPCPFLLLYLLCPPYRQPNGNPTAPGDYRGIAVGTLLSKIYASVLDGRIQWAAETHGQRASGQFGFRQDRSCAQAIFVLTTLIQVRRRRGGSMHVCYVDFQKAYDSVNRELLWGKMRGMGYGGWIMDACTALYANVPMCVKTSEGYTTCFLSNVGVKQGCPLSPTLFGLFVDDFEEHMHAAAERGADLQVPCIQDCPVWALMYADDLALMANTMAGLQLQLNELQAYSTRWQLTVNVTKTKVVSYGRNAAAHGQHRVPLSYAGHDIEHVSEFKYLGIQLHSTNAVCAVSGHRARAGAKALHAFRRRAAELGIQDPIALMRLFDTMVSPVLSYGSEVWAPHMMLQKTNPCDKVQLGFLRRLVGVRQSTSSLIVYAETGQLPLSVQWGVRLARFWNCLVQAPSGSLVNQAFMASAELARAHSDRGGHAAWAGRVAEVMDQNGITLDLQSPQPIPVRHAKQQFLLHFVQQFSNIEGTKNRTYVNDVRGGICIDSHCPAPYLVCIRQRSRRQALAQLRTGSHWLAEETGRWHRVAQQQRSCTYCDTGTVESTKHVIFECSHYASVRSDFTQLFTGLPSQNLISFFGQQDQRAVAAFCKACHGLHT